MIAGVTAFDQQIVEVHDGSASLSRSLDRDSSRAYLYEIGHGLSRSACKQSASLASFDTEQN